MVNSALVATHQLQVSYRFCSTCECEFVLLQTRVPTIYCKKYINKPLVTVQRCNKSTFRLVYLIVSFILAYNNSKPNGFSPYTLYLVKQPIKTYVLFINMVGMLIFILQIKHDKCC